jgi:nicotinamidase-related amidase
VQALELGTAAVLLMDLQEAMCRPNGRIGADGLAAEIARRDVLGQAGALLSALRRHRANIIHVRVGFDEDYSLMTSASPRFALFAERGLMRNDSSESRICAEVAPVRGEVVLTKGCVNPFVGTALMSVLRRKSVNHLVLAGVATNHVVEGTARFAADSGFHVTVLENVCAGASQEMHRFSVEKILPSYATVTTSRDLLERIGG